MGGLIQLALKICVKECFCIVRFVLQTISGLNVSSNSRDSSFRKVFYSGVSVTKLLLNKIIVHFFQVMAWVSSVTCVQSVLG